MVRSADAECWRVLWSQGVARQGAEAMWVRLGAVMGQPQAELDGFKSRALRAEVRSQRQLYVESRPANSIEVHLTQPGSILNLAIQDGQLPAWHLELVEATLHV